MLQADLGDREAGRPQEQEDRRGEDEPQWLGAAPIACSCFLHHAPVAPAEGSPGGAKERSEEHTSELQSLMRISYAVFCLKKKNRAKTTNQHQRQNRN